jgi:enoyl reductase-like protein
MKKELHEVKHKVITFLDRKEVEFLDKLKNDALFTTGHKLSYNDILKGLVDLAIDAHFSAENVDSIEKLEEKMLEKIKETLEKMKKEAQDEK